MEKILIIVLCIVAYFLGAVNFARVFAKLKHMDITKQGSGNPGTMNVLRTIGKLWGVLTFVCDALKGLLMALVGLLVLKDIQWAFILGFISVVGHMFPIYTKFKGGKGVATSLGVFLVINPIISSIILAALIIMLYVFKYGFLGSIVAISVVCIYTTIKFCIFDKFALQGEQLIVSLVFCWLFWVFVVAKHYGNFIRLFKGKENTLQLGKNNGKTDLEQIKNEQTNSENEV